MRTRLNFNGGSRQESRMIQDKLKSLKKALLYSYQAATAILEDGREFRCLINPDKIKTEYKDKIISIPFEDICVGRMIDVVDEETGELKRVEAPPAPPSGKTTESFETIGLKVGDTFEWKETNSHWLVYLQYLEEDAYFRARIRNCDTEIEINGKTYRGYMRGPDEDETLWRTKHNISWVDVDYTALLYITNCEETRRFFHRFQKMTIYDKPWEVQVVDSISNEGLLMVALKETFNNEIEEQIKQKELEEMDKDKGEQTIQPKDPEDENDEETDLTPHIIGNTKVYPYDIVSYAIENLSGGTWIIDNEKKAVIRGSTDEEATVQIITGKSGKFNLIYRKEGQEDIVLSVTIASL